MNFTFKEWHNFCSSIDATKCHNISKIPELSSNGKMDCSKT